jgi:hypothetical protein
MNKKLIVTFSCNNYVNVYAKSGVLPRSPFKTHNTEEDAVNYLKESRGIDSPKIVYYEY